MSLNGADGLERAWPFKRLEVAPFAFLNSCAALNREVILLDPVRIRVGRVFAHRFHVHQRGAMTVLALRLGMLAGCPRGVDLVVTIRTFLASQVAGFARSGLGDRACPEVAQLAKVIRHGLPPDARECGDRDRDHRQ
jgi:hypothetical protein